MARSFRKNGNSGAHPLPPIDELREVFEADFERGLLYRKLLHRPGDNRGPLGSPSGVRKHLSTCYKGRKYKVHRVIYALFHGRDPGDLVIDHINHDAFDNRIANLRECTLAQNTHHVKGKKPNNKSGYRGVYWRAKNNSWAATVSLGARRRQVKAGFRCPTAAAVWAQQRRKEVHADFCGGV